MFLFIRAINSSLELLHATDGNQNIQLVVSKLETLSLHILILFPANDDAARNASKHGICSQFSNANHRNGKLILAKKKMVV